MEELVILFIMLITRHDNKVHSRIPISQTSKGHKNWFEKSKEASTEIKSKETKFGLSYLEV